MPELTYKQLVKAVTDLETASVRDAEAIRTRADKINEIAADTARTAETISTLAVDPATIAETKDLARVFWGISESIANYAYTGNDTAKAAKAVADQARTTHAGIQEQFSRAPVDLSGVNREWLRQE